MFFGWPCDSNCDHQPLQASCPNPAAPWVPAPTAAVPRWPALPAPAARPCTATWRFRGKSFEKTLQKGDQKRWNNLWRFEFWRFWWCFLNLNFGTIQDHIEWLCRFESLLSAKRWELDREHAATSSWFGLRCGWCIEKNTCPFLCRKCKKSNQLSCSWMMNTQLQ